MKICRPTTWVLLLAFWLTSLTAWGQAKKGSDLPAFPDLGSLDSRESARPELEVSAQYRVAAAGGTGELSVTARLRGSWYIYSVTQKAGGPIPTKVHLDASSDYELSGPFQPDQPPKIKSVQFFKVPVEEHHGQVTWTAPFRMRAGVDPRELKILGKLTGQICDVQGACIPLTTMDTRFVAQLAPGEPTVTATVDPAESSLKRMPPIDRVEAADPPQTAVVAPPADGPRDASVSFDLSQIVVDEGGDQPIGWILVLAFIGGFVLNFMPCVLPVIGLKIMAFVQQAGENRARVFMLNVWYALGMLSIFWLLATLASAASLGLSQESLGWGEQFNYDAFTIPLLCVIFTMGLSFLGVWEIPIPGFAGSGRAAEMAQKEGVAGAFSKGVITTILATPCSGPGLATALTWSATKPPHLVYLVFTFMGLGMALPYLVIGAFPRLIRFIPKPGAWMDTFKQLMGFVLMGTVVYMFTLVQPERVIPTLALIFALWAGCWWVGRADPVASFGTKMRAWASAAVFVALIGWFAYGYQPDKQNELPWQPYTLSTLDQYVKANHTVMVDFTADW
jgi:thiol:disulfide interchange protein